MSNLTERTELEQRFKKLHNQLIEKRLFDLAIELSEVYFKSKTESYSAGIDFMKEINNL